MTSDQFGLDSAYDAYLREKSASAGLALGRALRLSGHAEEAIRVVKELADRVKEPFFRAQIGIDMNYLGLFSQAETLLTQAITELDHEPDLRILKVELAISQYAQGRFREAHAPESTTARRMESSRYSFQYLSEQYPRVRENRRQASAIRRIGRGEACPHHSGGRAG
ncbi:hypothetical protein [Burkholderia sp. BCC0419]|uniref:hypothetical protein n=1 Tax=Burkholderia sp. BCC0419 TaxID=486878 RepID=UPI00158D43F0|nr:hypothetical protein [Burkholderia sp. BCC0419]